MARAKKSVEQAEAAPEPVFTAYILRTCASDMSSHGGFVWPESGHVAAPDWDARPVCGYGLHGFLWGEGSGSLADWSPDAKWLVAGVTEWVDLDGKVKFPEAWVVHCGDRLSATTHIQALGARGAVVGVTATAGDRGTATAGYRGTATAGDSGTATAGDSGTATAGNRGTATAGDSGTATAGYRGTATAGYSGTVICKFYDRKADRWRFAVGYPGEDGIKANTPYRADDNGKLVEAL